MAEVTFDYIDFDHSSKHLFYQQNSIFYTSHTENMC